MELIIHTFKVKLKHTFTISRWSRDYQDTVIVELKEGPLSGFGEAAVNKYYNVSTEDVISDLTQLKDTIEGLSNEKPKEFWEKMNRHLSNNSFALCALDMAFWDLYARKQGKKLYELWELDPSHNPMTNYTIGIGEIDTMKARIREMPWPLYKIKLGTEHDIEIVRQLREETEATFRVDANCAWSAQQTIAFSEELKTLGVEFIEQPLPRENLEEMKEVYKHSHLPLIADESCIKEEDVTNCYGNFHGINIKLTKCGGLTPALRMINQAKTLKMRIMVGCMTESSVGISAIAHVLPLLDYVDMDGALLFEKDIAFGVSIQNGTVSYATKNGTGAGLL